MKLWILRPVDCLVDGDNPWEPWFDKAFGFVVRAKSEKEARILAHNDAGDENRGEFLNNQIAKTKSPWLDSKYSTCKELSSDGDSVVVIRDFASA